MLKITETEIGSRTTLILEGKLVGPWVAELEKTWADIQQARGPENVFVDLMDVTLISERGQELLRRMLAAGTTFNCCRGVHTKRVVTEILNRFGRVHGCTDGNRR